MTGGSVTVRVQLPHHLRSLAGVNGEVLVEVGRPTPERPTELQTEGSTGGRIDDSPDGGGTHGPTVADLLDALEARFPALEGTIRAHDGGPRRAYLRFFTCGEDVSHEGEEFPLPRAVLEGREAFRVVGAISGGSPSSARPRETAAPSGPLRGHGPSSSSRAPVGTRCPTQKSPNSA